MAISDEELVRQLEAVPLVEPPEMRSEILSRIRAPKPVVFPAKRRVSGLVIGLAWAAAVVIVLAVVLQRQSLTQENTSATMAPVDKWQIVASVAVPDEGKLIVRRSGDQFALQPSASNSEPISVAWDQKKLEMADVVTDPEVVILQRKTGATGSALIQLNVGGREVLRTTIPVD